MVKNITLSAEESLIAGARKRAAEEHRTLNAAFREWLTSYAARPDRVDRFDELMDRLSYVRVGGKLTRDEMNER